MTNNQGLKSFRVYSINILGEMLDGWNRWRLDARVLTKSEVNIQLSEQSSNSQCLHWIFTCLLPDFSALTIFLRHSLKIDILTIVNVGVSARNKIL